MTYFFTVFGPTQHVFKNNGSKMIDLGHRNVFIVVLVFNVFIVERCIYSRFSLQCTSMYL